MGNYTDGNVTNKLGHKDPIRERRVTWNQW